MTQREVTSCAQLLLLLLLLQLELCDVTGFI